MVESRQAIDNQSINTDRAITTNPSYTGSTSNKYVDPTTTIPSSTPGINNAAEVSRSEYANETQPTPSYIGSAATNSGAGVHSTPQQADTISAGQAINPTLSRALIGGLIGATIGSLAGALAGKRLGQGFNVALKGIGEASKTIGAGLGQTAKGVGDAAKSVAEGATQAFADTPLPDTVQNTAQGIDQVVQGATELAKGTVESAANVAKQTAVGTLDALQNTAQGVNQAVQSATDVAKGAVENVTDATKQTAVGTLDAVQNTAQGVNQTVQGVAEKAKDTAHNDRPFEHQSTQCQDRSVAEKQESKNHEIAIRNEDVTPTIYISSPEPTEEIIVDSTNSQDSEMPTALFEEDHLAEEIARLE
jgi:hypothetical protein